MIPDRATLRATMLKKRRELSQPERDAAAAAVEERLLALEFPHGRPLNIASYVAVRGELETSSINRTLAELGHTLVLPRVIPGVPGAMDLYACPDPSCLKRGSFGIMEPDPEKCAQVTPAELDVVLLPLAAMDLCGNRLGMGGGYYDRLLVKLRMECLRAGLGYDFQLIEALEAEAWDMPLDLGITPGRLLRFAKETPQS